MTVELSGVYKAYSDRVRVLENINLRVSRGEYLAVTGPSGSGKSTLLNLIGLLDRPTGGKYVFDDQDVAGMPERRRSDIRARKIGFVFQQPHLIPGRSALENVRIGLTYAPERLTTREGAGLAAEALAVVGLEDRLEHQPDQLSGGEAQRVAMARAIVKRPSLLLCDEPTGNLDDGTTDRLMEALEVLLTPAVAVVVVTHDPKVARRARRRVHLRDRVLVTMR